MLPLVAVLEPDLAVDLPLLGGPGLRQGLSEEVTLPGNLEERRGQVAERNDGELYSRMCRSSMMLQVPKSVSMVFRLTPPTFRLPSW